MGHLWILRVPYVSPINVTNTHKVPYVYILHPNPWNPVVASTEIQIQGEIITPKSVFPSKDIDNIDRT